MAIEERALDRSIKIFKRRTFWQSSSILVCLQVFRGGFHAAL